MVRYFYELAGVRRRGYYAWLRQTDQHMEREQNDEKDYELIQEIKEESPSHKVAIQCFKRVILI
ncbi:MULTISPECIES: hypothetical protein [Bacillus cereus group]|uniref:Uncharacterized protein n=1 Tax=Bacillus cytotoxicus (strain DSM 22905 / CIP 110041 / 391-98 / NVH 391-98) TaxID=315749 RepID=A7GVC2_BACCN|nr:MULTISPECIES: hypothetical protein [Bacillus cereus group]ABS24080.1 hypothetical protein Bcer98_3895 [Bacillus cytotoxicus NVH 391-98]MDH2864782.1 hypothetical protein [Bacillus cytotoxicus]MDH2884630.1 hypothetical protein [Bacillus cytotoxicus]NZD33403.1 hypothetical protein [Bacillus cytotoxicus]SCN42809.1 Uncharacterized protein BC88300_04496 [Bacillus cytotoxicus]